MSGNSRLRKRAVTTYLEPQQWERLTALSRRTHVTMNWYLRAGLDRVLEEYGAPPELTTPGESARSQ